MTRAAAGRGKTLSSSLVLVLGLVLLGPGAASGDQVRHFTTTANAAGIRGDAGLTYQGLAHPRRTSNFVVGSVFKDPAVPSRVYLIGNNGDMTFDPVTGDEIAESDNHEVLVGQSKDGGNTFYYRRALRWDNGLRMTRVSLVPDPNRRLVWVGLGQMYQNIPDSAGESYLGTTRIEIDWSTKKVRLLNTNLTGWDEYTLGATNVPVPGVLSGIAQITHIAEVQVNGQTRFEAWASQATEPGTQTPCAPGNSNYTANTAMWSTNGKKIVWYHFDPADGVDLASKKELISPRLPSSYPRSDMLVTRGQLGTQHFLYVGTQEQIVCEEIVTGNSNGNSIRFVGLEYDSVLDNYREGETGFAIDIANPQAPNWTCANSSVLCTSQTRNNYGFVSLFPYVSGGTLHLYANDWPLHPRPTYPVIGEAGRIDVTHVKKVVSLQHNFIDPVVLAQAPSFVGTAPVAVRISDVQPGSFTIQLQEDSVHDGTHASERVHWAVFERGTYRLEDRRVLEVDRVDTAQVLPATTEWKSKLDLRDSMYNDTGLLVFTQLQTHNDPVLTTVRSLGPPTFETTRPCNPIGQCGNVRTATVDFGLDPEEAAGTSHAVETVGIVAVGETWLGRGSGVFRIGAPETESGFDVGRVQNVGSVGNVAWTPLAFESPKLGDLGAALFFAWIDSRNGGDPTLVRYRYLSYTDVEIAIDEDQSADVERSHVEESVVYWAIGGRKCWTPYPGTSCLLRGQPISPEVDQMF